MYDSLYRNCTLCLWETSLIFHTLESTTINSWWLIKKPILVSDITFRISINAYLLLQAGQILCIQVFRRPFVICESVNNWSIVTQVPPTGQGTTFWPQLEWVWWFPSMLHTLYGRLRPCRASSEQCLTGTGTLSLQWTLLIWATTQIVHYQNDRR